MLNKQKGNMYTNVTHTWNPIKGHCDHGCGYCYMKRWGEQKPVRLDEKELKTNLGENNTIFVGSGTDMFQEKVKSGWIDRVLEICRMFPKNTYLFQTKNTKRYIEPFNYPIRTYLGTTIETNRYYSDMGNTIRPEQRVLDMKIIKELYAFLILGVFVTVEPIMKFDLDVFSKLLNSIQADWISFGADSCGNHLNEPNREDIIKLIDNIECKTIVKKNLKRLIGDM